MSLQGALVRYAGLCSYSLSGGKGYLSLLLVKPQQLPPLFLKSVRVHFAYGRIALTLELLGRFGQFLDKDDRCNSPVLLIPFSRLLGL